MTISTLNTHTHPKFGTESWTYSESTVNRWQNYYRIWKQILFCYLAFAGSGAYMYRVQKYLWHTHTLNVMKKKKKKNSEKPVLYIYINGTHITNILVHWTSFVQHSHTHTAPANFCSTQFQAAWTLFTTHKYHRAAQDKQTNNLVYQMKWTLEEILWEKKKDWQLVRWCWSFG